VSLQSRDIQQLLGKLSKIVCNWRGKVFRAAAARGDRVAKWRLHSKRRSVFRFIINMWKCYLLFELPCIKEYILDLRLWGPWKSHGGHLGCYAVLTCAWVSTFRRSVLLPSSGQYFLPKRWYLPTSQHGVRTQNTTMDVNEHVWKKNMRSYCTRIGAFSTLLIICDTYRCACGFACGRSVIVGHDSTWAGLRIAWHPSRHP
jgi:hypothetical protein